MIKSITLIAGVLLFALVAVAQDRPRYETFLGYTYIRANQNNNNTAIGEAIGSFDMNGGSGQFIYNVNKWISGVADIGAAHKGNIGFVNVENTTALFVFGPRFSHQMSRFIPYAQALFGVAYAANSR